MAIKITQNHVNIYESVINIAYKLIKYNYWDRISRSDLDAWLDNFETDEEKYLSAGILLSIIYRNDKSTKSFAANIIQIKLPNILKEHGIHCISSIEEWEADLKKGNHTLPIRFSALEGVDGKPGKSGSTIYRDIRQEFFHSNLGILCKDVKEKVTNNSNLKAIILFDDILGTGEQFESYIIENELYDLDIKILYFPFAAYNDSYEEINKKYNNVIVCPVEVINDSESLFSEKNIAFFGKVHQEYTPDELKELYIGMCKRKNIKSTILLGYGDLALTYFFNDSVPNNNIAALWYDSDTWTKLAGR
ncbi:phosphoribosyltransferase-like protein [Vibrio navarrensis]|uniref:phosphoribosyltransferase-like protein n=2 Tax=Vibrio navarrensis TaxID=29495 RepID=UPI00186998B3|nr:hypothetical protein [Vibrio navarrensis]MBE4609652.1 hypothetical protein [Vibrio navarrensis]